MTAPTRKLWLAAPRGFCAGVDRAIDIVNTAPFRRRSSTTWRLCTISCRT